MAIQKFTLKSGVVLQVDVATFEVAIAIVEAIKNATRGMGADKDEEIGDAVSGNADVRRAVVAAFPWVLYGNDVMTLSLMDDAFKGARVRGDYFEVVRRVIEVNAHPFFQTTSSGSTPPEEVPSKGPA